MLHVVTFLLAFVNERSLEFLDLSSLKLLIFRMQLLILDNIVAVLFYGLYIKVYATSLEFRLCCAHQNPYVSPLVSIDTTAYTSKKIQIMNQIHKLLYATKVSRILRLFLY